MFRRPWLTLLLGALSGGAFPHAVFAADPTAVPTKPAYPLTTCVVSGEKLGSMGKPLEYVHHEAGKPDRTVLLCCETCVEEFKADPAKFLAKLDKAAASAAKK